MSSSKMSSFVASPDGRPQNVVIDDEGEGAPVVLLHSSGMSGDQWKRTTAALRKAGRRTIAPHLLGYGRSDPWPDGAPFSYLHDVTAVDGLLSEIGEPVDLVGHSYGGLIALLVTLRAPERVRSLALFDPVAFGVLEAGREPEATADVERLGFAWGTTAAEHEAWLASFIDYWNGSPGAWASLREPMREEMRRTGWSMFEGARTLVADTTRADAYAHLRVPTLLMTGAATPVAAGRVVQRLGEALHGARVVRFDDAGHMGPLTHTARFNELLLEHLGGSSGAPY